MSDFPIDLPDDIVDRWGHAFDAEGKIPRALDGLVSFAGREVLLLDSPSDGIRARQIRSLEARVTTADDPTALEAGSADVIVGLWSALARPGSDDERTAVRVARPGGQILALHDYGRDDRQALIDTASHTATSTSPGRLEAPFLAAGWKVRVIHCFWTFKSLDEARSFAESFGESGRAVAAAMTRPRLSHNLAIFHRTVPAEP